MNILENYRENCGHNISSEVKKINVNYLSKLMG